MNKLILFACLIFLAIIACEESQVIEPEVLEDKKVDTLEVVNYEIPNDMVIEFGHSHNLPTIIEVNLIGDSSINVPIEWNGYFNPVQSGTYDLTGEFYQKHLLLKEELPLINISVEVKEKEDSIILGEYQTINHIGKCYVTNNDYPYSLVHRIHRDSTILSETEINSFEYAYRIIETAKERDEFYDNTYANILNKERRGYGKESVFSNDIYIIWIMVFRGKNYEIIDPIYAADAIDIFKTDKDRFYESFGDSYLKELTTISTIISEKLISLHSKNETERHEMIAKLMQEYDLSGTGDIPDSFSYGWRRLGASYPGYVSKYFSENQELYKVVETMNDEFDNFKVATIGSGYPDKDIGYPIFKEHDLDSMN